jgi:putative ubiquitin-RnfH superfamily antitoxin RatB of RatAB toxin-antitoxin module
VNQGTAIRVEVACAMPDKQEIVTVMVPEGTVARAVVDASAIQALFPALDMAACQLGVFGQAVKDTYCVAAGDRVEIYRPLVNDPRDNRRTLASRGETMGKSGLSKN